MLLSILAVVSLSATVYFTWQMRSIDDTYAILIDGHGRANLAIARANRNLIYVDRSIFRLIIEESEDGIQQSKKEIADYSEYFHKQIRAAVAAMPTKAAEINEIATAFDDAMEKSCAETVALASSTTPEDKKAAAASMRARCDPVMNEAMVNFAALTNRILKISDEASDGALAMTDSTIRGTFLLTLGGLLIAVILVGGAVIKVISQPLLKLTACMNRLAGGDDDIEIVGRDRFDEIGSIANAVERFRQNSMKKRQAEIAKERERAALDNARQIAENALAVKTEFFSNISHELRTPMHAILAFSKQGSKYLAKGKTEQVQEFLEIIATSGERLNKLLDQLLDLTKMEAGKMKYSASRSDFDAVVKHTLAELDSLLQSKNIKVDVRALAQDRFAEFDKLRMVQVLVNLVSNAIKYSPSESLIEICVQDDVLADNCEALRCSVADQGVGIPENECETIFSEFTQSSKTKTGAGGTGLGLSICRNIIEAHGGKIWAENGRPKGAIFSFIFPKFNSCTPSSQTATAPAFENV
jgi:signal transduction histidine kinase